MAKRNETKATKATEMTTVEATNSAAETVSLAAIANAEALPDDAAETAEANRTPGDDPQPGEVPFPLRIQTRVNEIVAKLPHSGEVSEETKAQIEALNEQIATLTSQIKALQDSEKRNAVESFARETWDALGKMPEDKREKHTLAILASEYELVLKVQTAPAMPAKKSKTSGSGSVSTDDVLSVLTREPQTIAQIAEALGVSTDQVGDAVSALRVSKKIATEGQRRGMKYLLA